MVEGEYCRWHPLGWDFRPTDLQTHPIASKSVGIESVLPMKSVIRNGNLALRFLLELATLAASALWGATLDGPLPLRMAASAGVPVAIALLWGAFVSPKARFSTGRGGQSGLGLLIFLSAAGMLAQRGHADWSVGFALSSAVSSAIHFALFDPNLDLPNRT